LEHLRRRGVPALVVAPEAGADEHEGTPVVRVPAVSVPGVPSLPVGLPTRRLHQVLERFAPDVVHLASPFVLGAGGLLAARRLGVPAVAVYQTDMAGFAHRYGAGLTASAAWRWTCRLHRSADRTLAPSAATVAALRGAGVGRVHRWGRGVDSVLFCPSRRDPALRARLAAGEELLVGYVGRLAPEKQVRRLVELAALPGIHLVVVGDGPERHAAEAAARKLGLAGRAHFTGFLPHATIPAVLRHADVLAMPSVYEELGSVLLEAMAAGLPIVASRTGGIPDAVGDAAELVTPGDPRALAAAIDRLLGDRAAAGRLAERARRRAARYDWTELADGVLGVYRSLLTLDGGRDTPSAAPGPTPALGEPVA
jgi:phosphatidylinositol alpha 1,6-mannosyltransferase